MWPWDAIKRAPWDDEGSGEDEYENNSYYEVVSDESENNEEEEIEEEEEAEKEDESDEDGETAGDSLEMKSASGEEDKKLAARLKTCVKRLQLPRIEKEIGAFERKFKKQLRIDWHDGYDSQVDVFRVYLSETVDPVLESAHTLAVKNNTEHMLAHAAAMILVESLESFRETLEECRMNVFEAQDESMEHGGVVGFMWWHWCHILIAMVKESSLDTEEVSSCLQQAINQIKGEDLIFDALEQIEDETEEEDIEDLACFRARLFEVKHAAFLSNPMLEDFQKLHPQMSEDNFTLLERSLRARLEEMEKSEEERWNILECFFELKFVMKADKKEVTDFVDGLVKACERSKCMAKIASYFKEKSGEDDPKDSTCPSHESKKQKVV